MPSAVTLANQALGVMGTELRTRVTRKPVLVCY